MTLTMKLILTGLIFLTGAAAGFWVKGSIVARQTVGVQDKALKEQAEKLAQRLKDETVARDAAEQRAKDAQADTAQLNDQLADLRAKNLSLQEQIDHAPLDAPKPLPVAGQCPGNPLAGVDFRRLYDAAAQGLAAPGP